MCGQDSTSKQLVIRCTLLLFASRASSRCKHDMGALSWLNVETVESAPPMGALSQDYGIYLSKKLCHKASTRIWNTE